MNLRKIIEETIIEIISEEIVKEVLRRIEKIPKKALVIFTGGSIGFQESMKQVSRLKEEGWQLKILLSGSAEYVLTKPLIEKMLGDSQIEIYGESDDKKASYYYSDIDKVVIPVLTMNTAAKVALGISDTLVTNIIAHCLMADIPIVAAKNACDPLNEERISIGMGKANKRYIVTKTNHMSALEDYGIQLVKAKDLYNSASKNTGAKLCKQEKKDICSKTATFISKKVLTRADIMEAFHQKKDLFVSTKTIVTDAAKDAARGYDVKILVQ